MNSKYNCIRQLTALKNYRDSHGFQHPAERGMIFGYNKATDVRIDFNVFIRALLTIMHYCPFIAWSSSSIVHGSHLLPTTSLTFFMS